MIFLLCGEIILKGEFAFGLIKLKGGISFADVFFTMLNTLFLLEKCFKDFLGFNAFFGIEPNKLFDFNINVLFPLFSLLSKFNNILEITLSFNCVLLLNIKSSFFIPLCLLNIFCSSLL